MVKKLLAALGVLFTQQILSFRHDIVNNLLPAVNFYIAALLNWVQFVQFKKNVKNTDGGVLILVTYACNFTKSNTPPWVFFMFFKLYNWHQIAQSI